MNCILRWRTGGLPQDWGESFPIHKNRLIIQVVIVKAFIQCARFRVYLRVTAFMEKLCASSSSPGRVKSGANQRDWSSSRPRNGDCTPVCSR